MASRHPDIDFLGTSEVTEEDLNNFFKMEYVADRSQAREPSMGQKVSMPQDQEVVVFTSFFEVGLCFPCASFLVDVLLLF